MAAPNSRVRRRLLAAALCATVGIVPVARAANSADERLAKALVLRAADVANSIEILRGPIGTTRTETLSDGPCKTSATTTGPTATHAAAFTDRAGLFVASTARVYRSVAEATRVGFLPSRHYRCVRSRLPIRTERVQAGQRQILTWTKLSGVEVAKLGADFVSGFAYHATLVANGRSSNMVVTEITIRRKRVLLRLSITTPADVPTKRIVSGLVKRLAVISAEAFR